MLIEIKKISRVDVEIHLENLGFPGSRIIVTKEVKGSILVVFVFQGKKISRFISPQKVARIALDRRIKASKQVQWDSFNRTTHNYRVNLNSCNCLDHGMITVEGKAVCKHTINFAQKIGKRSIAQMIGVA